MNIIIMQVLKKNLDDAKDLWAEKFLKTLYGYRKTHKGSKGEMRL